MSQPPPEEHRDEISPSRAIGSRDEEREDLPEEPPREEPPRDEDAGAARVALVNCPGSPRPKFLGLGGDAAEAVPPLLKAGEVRTEPSGCCTRSHTSFQLGQPCGRLGAAPSTLGPAGPAPAMAGTIDATVGDGPGGTGLLAVAAAIARVQTGAKACSTANYLKE